MCNIYNQMTKFVNKIIQVMNTNLLNKLHVSWKCDFTWVYIQSFVCSNQNHIFLSIYTNK